eukprot:s606_g17.t1
MSACAGDLLDEVEEHLQRPQDPDVSDINGRRAIHFAAANGHRECVRLLAEAGANREAADKVCGATPLHLACLAGHPKMVSLLLELGAQTDLVSREDGSTPLHWVTETACREGSLEVLRLLLEAKAQTCKARRDGSTAMHLVSSEGRLNMLRLLLDFRAEVDVVNGDGATPMHLAAQDGHLEVAEALLRAGAEKDHCKIGTGATPLHLATEGGHHHVVELLIRWSANTDLAADDGRTPLQVAALYGYSKVVALLQPGANNGKLVAPEDSLGPKRRRVTHERFTKKSHDRPGGLEDSQQGIQSGVRARAVEKVQRQLAELAEDDMGSGVPDDFLEEAKAVTDGHVVFLDDAINKDGQATWAIDIQESVARGITANSIQNRYLDMLESLKLKAFLMNAEKESQVMDNEDMDVKLDNAPLRALMQQSVGDVMTPEDEAILLLLAEEAAARAAASRPLAAHVVNLTKQARIRQDDVKERRRRVALLRRWVEATWEEGSDIEGLVAKHAEELADALELKPLERKRLLAAIEEGVSQEVPTETEESLLAEDAQVRYEHLRSLLQSLRKELPPGMDVTNAEAEDIALFLGYLRAKKVSHQKVRGQDVNSPWFDLKHSIFYKLKP